MNKYTTVTDDIKYIGVDDLDIDLFEGQYIVPEGMAYNSYLIADEHPCIMDAVDERKADEWLDKIDVEPEYLVMLHCEPDHSGAALRAMERFPNMTLVCSAKAAEFFEQFHGNDANAPVLKNRPVKIVKEGDELNLGRHTLRFISAPLVHWPEVLMAYDVCDRVLFAADAFGKFGALCNETDDWTCEARRYYFNICGKYGVQVQKVLQKVSALDVQTICPLHGPVLNENLGTYISLYDTWSSYRHETEGVFIAYCSFHGNTAQVAQSMCDTLKSHGIKVAMNDLSRDDYAEGIEDAFRYPQMILCSPTYDGGLPPVMQKFLSVLAAKNYQKRTVALVENGTWAPQAARLMRAELEKMKGIVVRDKVITIHSQTTPTVNQEIDDLLAEIGNYDNK